MVATGMSGKFPTMKVIEGTCRQSLAIVVMAQEHGEDDPAVQRAHQLYEVNIPGRTPSRNLAKAGRQIIAYPTIFTWVQKILIFR